jgi:hypothetical protein
MFNLDEGLHSDSFKKKKDGGGEILYEKWLAVPTWKLKLYR